jgi:hypothetical protein
MLSAASVPYIPRKSLNSLKFNRVFTGAYGLMLAQR